MLINAPESRDADFSWRSFIESHNGELLGAYGNFVNRTLKFIEKLSDFQVDDSGIDPGIRQRIDDLYNETGRLIEAAHMKTALTNLFAFIRRMNKFFDEKQPWRAVREDKSSAYGTLNTCLYSLANLAQLLSPFLPFSSKKLGKSLHMGPFNWKPVVCPASLPETMAPLFDPIDAKQIEEEVERLNEQSIKK